MTEQQQRELAAGLKALAASTRDLSASTSARQHVEHAARQHVEHAARPHGRTPHVSTSARGTSHVARPHVWLPLAAGLLLATASAVWMARSAVPPAPVEPAGFVALPEVERLPLMESANIVRVSLPVAALPVYGVAVADFKTESVEAELLVAQDGQARAIRLVSNLTDTRSANND